jgi:16S rRNA processing protein RimM
VSDTVELLVGKIGRAHGIRGDLTIDVRTDEPERRFSIGTIFETRHGPLTVQSTHWHGTRLLVRFSEVPDRTVAESLRGTELRIEVPADERPDDPEEFYDHQLVGLAAYTTTGESVGEVAEVIHAGGQDLLEIRTPDGEVLVPFVQALVPTVDLEQGRLEIADRPGLLRELEADS